MGDYNIDFFYIESHGPTSDYNDALYSNCFIPLITRSIRITNSQPMPVNGPTQHSHIQM